MSTPSDTLFSLLKQHAQTAHRPGNHPNLLPRFADAASRDGLSSSTLAKLRALCDRGAALSLDIPNDDGRTQAWTERRAVFWPSGVPAARRIGICSSRLGRSWDSHRSWFAALRTACLRVDREQELLLTVGSTTTQRFVSRCGELFGLRVVRMVVASDSLGWTQWWQHIEDDLEADAVHISPPIDLNHGLSPSGPAHSEPLADVPFRDRLLATMCDRLICLSLRPGGYWQRLVHWRLDDSSFPPASVFLALGDGLVPKSIARPLMDQGAVGWLLVDSDGRINEHSQPPWPFATEAAAKVIPVPAGGDWPFLTHCTRRRVGPWPDEDEVQFLDDLILEREGADHSAFAALSRIARSKRLVATADLVRGDTPVVSFTEVPLADLPNLRRFRSHLGRWDFEPYGICIDRDVLSRRRARPVIYGDDATWQTLSAQDRPRFQTAKSVSASGRETDWTIEQEWRHVGDVALDEISADDAFLFVPSETEARAIASISDWPVCVVERSGQ